jgi:hypothetical protein
MLSLLVPTVPVHMHTTLSDARSAITVVALSIFDAPSSATTTTSQALESWDSCLLTLSGRIKPNGMHKLQQGMNDSKDIISSV